MAPPQPLPLDSQSGFFQALPVVPPQYTCLPGQSSTSPVLSDDPVIPRILSTYLPSPLPTTISRPLEDFAHLVLAPSTLRLTVDAETSPPTLHPLTTFGEENRVDALRTSEGWRGLKAIGIREGTVGLGYPDANLVQGRTEQASNRRIQQFVTLHLWHGSAALVTCPAAMTDGAAVLLGRHLNDSDGDQPGRAMVLAEVRRRLISRNPGEAWTSGQWMTERIGGSDVTGTETVARRLSSQEIIADDGKSGAADAVGMPLGFWRVDGSKWFSSATDADSAVLLAKTETGISAFYAPMRRRSVKGVAEMNGIRISRLKNKLGTKGLPTSELEIKCTRAWMIGEEGKGVKEISAILNLTRLHTASAAVGYWGRGLAIARAYAKHVKWMADETVKYRVAASLTFFGVALLGASEQGADVLHGTKAETLIPGARPDVLMLLRVLTPVIKAQVSLASVDGLRACMESLGGVGYCENNEDGGIMNVARLYRDANVGTIWEGTTSVMGEDLVRALQPKGGYGEIDAALNHWIETALQNCGKTFKGECASVQRAWQKFRCIVSQREVQELHYRGRELLRYLEAIVGACLLLHDASHDQDAVSTAVAKRWMAMTLEDVSLIRTAHWIDEAKLDSMIFQGHDLGMQSKVDSKL